ncbi:MAG: tripartite tricarboxylate transporter substrate binding protein [Betaproteobacteria bacterium]|nr:tripartite tricarboxylate transporter substrate binding protein [Betaproteobacteria bacterium]
MRYRLIAAIFLALCGSTGLAQPTSTSSGQAYPVKPIRVVVGGSPDAVPRILGQKIVEDWGQQLVVDQRGGAGGTIAAEIVARSAPDGYTLLLVTSTHMMSVNFFKVSYDMVRDFAPITQIASTSFVLAVHPSLPAKSVKELIRLARQKPGALNYGSGGSGSPAHLIGEMFRGDTGVNLVHVPYKTVAEAVTGLMSGQVQMMFVVSTAAVPQIQAGRIRGLGVTSMQRSPVVPDLPTLDELGVRKFEATAWYGFIAPAGTPQAIVTRLHDEVRQVLKLPEITQRLANLGLEPIGSSSQAFGEFIKAELAKWAKIARSSGAKVE